MSYQGTPTHFLESNLNWRQSPPKIPSPGENVIPPNILTDCHPMIKD
jgi:hypothetical protein